MIDSAGNEIKEPSPWCSWCLGPTDTGGRCVNGCEIGVAVVAASTIDTRDKRIKELEDQIAAALAIPQREQRKNGVFSTDWRMVVNLMVEALTGGRDK